MATDVESNRFHLTRRAEVSAPAPAPAADVPTLTGNVLGMLFGALAVVLLAGIAATCVGLAGLAVVKSVDVLYAGTHFVRHWSDDEAVAPNAELCKGLFCRRADTELKHVSGSAGKQSERLAAFCPEHGRSDFLVFLDLSHLGTLMWYGYGAGVLICTIVWVSLAGSAASAVVGSPALVFLDAERRRTFFGACYGIGLVLGILVGCVAGLAYVWW